MGGGRIATRWPQRARRSRVSPPAARRGDALLQAEAAAASAAAGLPRSEAARNRRRRRRRRRVRYGGDSAPRRIWRRCSPRRIRRARHELSSRWRRWWTPRRWTRSRCTCAPSRCARGGGRQRRARARRRRARGGGSGAPRHQGRWRREASRRTTSRRRGGRGVGRAPGKPRCGRWRRRWHPCRTTRGGGVRERRAARSRRRRPARASGRETPFARDPKATFSGARCSSRKAARSAPVGNAHERRREAIRARRAGDGRAAANVSASTGAGGGVESRRRPAGATRLALDADARVRRHRRRRRDDDEDALEAIRAVAPEAFILRKFDFPAVRAKVTSVERGRAGRFRAPRRRIREATSTFFDADAASTLAVEGSASMPVGAFVRTPGVFKLRRFDFVKAEGVRGGGGCERRASARVPARRRLLAAQVQVPPVVVCCCVLRFSRLNCMAKIPHIDTEHGRPRSPSPARPRRVSQPSSRTSQSTARGMDVAFKRVGPGEEVPPPRRSWRRGGEHRGRHARGMVYGAVRGYRAHDPQYAEVAAIVAKRHRWMRATSEATLGGLRLGSFVAVFSAVQLASASQGGRCARHVGHGRGGRGDRGRDGLGAPRRFGRSIKDRTRRARRGGLCLPLGYVTQELDRLIPPSEPREPIESETRIVTRDAGTSRRGGAYLAPPRRAIWPAPPSRRSKPNCESERRGRKTRGSRGCEVTESLFPSTSP